MDPRGNIYSDDPENIPPEDKARLDGYLRGRAEADEKALLQAAMDEKLAEIERLQGEAAGPGRGEEDG